MDCKYTGSDIIENCSDRIYVEIFKPVLTIRQYTVICMRHGHYDGKKWTYKEIGKELYKKAPNNWSRIITKVRASQIYRQAIRKIWEIEKDFNSE